MTQKQRSVEVSETHQELTEVHEEERSLDLEELAKLKMMNGKSMQGIDKIRLIEFQAEKAMISEKIMLESMVHQTKQLEQTKISLEEAKLEIMNLQENIRMLENSTSISRRRSLDNNESLEPVCTQEEIRKLRNDLRLALEAEEKSKKAMDDFAVALKELTTEANQANAELAIAQSESERAREEAKCDKSLLKIAEHKLLEALDVYTRLKLEYEESIATWMEKEANLVNCIRIYEEQLTKEKQENTRMTNGLKTAKEENTKLRDIIKQAMNEAIMVKEAMDAARNENFQLKNQLFEKESALQQIRRNYDSLKVSEVAALDSVRELKSLLETSSTSDSNKSSKLSTVGSFNLSKAVINNAKLNKCLKLFPTDKVKPDYYPVNSMHRHSVGESDTEASHGTKKVLRTSSSNVSDIQSPLFKVERRNLNLDSDELEGLTGKQNLTKKKAVLGRIGDTLRRRSFRN